MELCEEDAENAARLLNFVTEHVIPFVEAIGGDIEVLYSYRNFPSFRGDSTTQQAREKFVDEHYKGPLEATLLCAVHCTSDQGFCSRFRDILNSICKVDLTDDQMKSMKELGLFESSSSEGRSIESARDDKKKKNDGEFETRVMAYVNQLVNVVENSTDFVAVVEYAVGVSRSLVVVDDAIQSCGKKEVVEACWQLVERIVVEEVEGVTGSTLSPNILAALEIFDQGDFWHRDVLVGDVMMNPGVVRDVCRMILAYYHNRDNKCTNSYNSELVMRYLFGGNPETVSHLPAVIAAVSSNIKLDFACGKKVDEVRNLAFVSRDVRFDILDNYLGVAFRFFREAYRRKIYRNSEKLDISRRYTVVRGLLLFLFDFFKHVSLPNDATVKRIRRSYLDKVAEEKAENLHDAYTRAVEETLFTVRKSEQSALRVTAFERDLNSLLQTMELI